MSGGAIQEQLSYGPTNGYVTGIEATNDNEVDGHIANYAYQWNQAGELTQRQDSYYQLTEKFCHNHLGQLTNYSVNQDQCNEAGNQIWLGYDPLGNITEKTDVCTSPNCYVYPTSGPAAVRPHAVSTINPCPHCSVDGVGNGVATNFYYDNNGNMLCVTGHAQCDGYAALSMQYFSFNKVSSVAQGSTTLTYAYDPEHNRIAQNAPQGTTNYFNDPASNVMSERFSSGSSYTWRTYIMVEGKIVAVRIAPSSTPISMRYFVTDHLGSIAVMTDTSGNVLNRYSFDPWGLPRDPTTWSNPNCSADGPQAPYTRGFTGQEHLPGSICLINFNARLYDPQIGRFQSPDPTIEAPYNPQDLNRYSYVLNDPMSFTDPSGLCFLGCFWQNPIFDAVLEIAILFVLPELEGTTFLALANEASEFKLAAIGTLALNGGIAGGLTAAVAGGNVVRGFWMGAAQAGATFGIGGPLGNALGTAVGSATAGQLIAQGAVGGLMSVANHQNFVSGFLAAGVGSLGGPLTGNEFSIQGVAISAVLGGGAAVLGGGKFENGAITGAFAYAAQGVATDETDSPGALGVKGPPNQPVVDPTYRYDNYAQAAVALNQSIAEASTATGWEWGGFVVEQNGFYDTFIYTSESKLGISWDTASIAALKSAYDVLSFDHTHLQSVPVGKTETGMYFSNGDVDLHNFLEGDIGYVGTFVNWFSSMYFLQGGTSYGHNMLGVQGSRCPSFPTC
jgi:RHS repeat-associated protein